MGNKVNPIGMRLQVNRTGQPLVRRYQGLR